MSETPEMVERVARAICQAEGIDPDFRDEILSARGGSPQWRYEIDAARAAIQAMREPTDAQRLAAYEAVERDDRWDIADDERWAKSWRAGIDAALASPEDPEAVGQESLRTAPVASPGEGREP